MQSSEILFHRLARAATVSQMSVRFEARVGAKRCRIHVIKIAIRGDGKPATEGSMGLSNLSK